MDERHEFIAAEIERAYVNADDDWKKEYYHNAASYLAKNRYVEGGKICAFCREQGMADPHHHNVWGAMITSLKKLGWVEKIGMIEPTTKHTHINQVCQWESKLFR
jgi:hypothetical protein|tara:strand:+ start:1397 stop:1711 length:315 start_codon:yes stop_codon:yes gene_type:complete